MNDIATAATTADILAGMFVENTGRHMLDSGGAYGRNFEREAGKVAADFLAEPTGSYDKYSGPTLSTFHFLNSRLDFDAQLQDEFDVFAEESDDSWLQVMEEFATDRGWEFITVNTYNHESALDQTIQYIQANTEGGDACYGDVVMLQIHGGCDVRGGYTAPKLFRCVGENEVGLLDDADVDIYCDGSTVVAPQVETLPSFDDTPPREIRHQWYSPDYNGNAYRSDDPEIQFDDNDKALCPCCTVPTILHVSGRYS